MVNEREGAVAGRGGAGEFGSKSLVGTADFVAVLQSDRTAFVNGGADDLIVVRNFPQYLAVGGFFDVFVGEAGNLLVAIEHDSQALPACSLLQKRLNPAR